MSQQDAVRLAHQATFGPTEALVADMQTKTAADWVAQQMAATGSRYGSGGGDVVHKYTEQGGTYCDTAAGKAIPNCWRDLYSSWPLMGDFYKNAVNNGDQLRQRVAYALKQIVVISAVDIEGTYGMRNYNNMLLDNAFGNYRDVLKKVTLSPVMGDYLSNSNNDKASPNENYARELLQLFSIGTCELNLDGTLKTGKCVPTYNNENVREYAYALTGWTYPAGGASPWGCWPQGTNCRYYTGDMVSVAAMHDTQARKLLPVTKTVPANTAAPQALELVLDSLMAHPNTAPFIGKQLIQHLVTSNPSPAYVQRVAQAFSAGKFASFGAGRNGDLAATVAAVLLDTEARSTQPARTFGRLREPVQMFTSTLRALNGKTDGEILGWWWGETLSQHIFRPPTVFNYYPPDYPVAGTPLVGPAFAIHNANTAIERINFLSYMNWVSTASDQANAATKFNLQPFVDAYTADLGASPADATAKLVDRLSMLAVGAPLPATARSEAIRAVDAWTQNNAGDSWRSYRVQQAVTMVFGSPQFAIVR
jgi:uncharacterized protein (DUF1800 family)